MVCVCVSVCVCVRCVCVCVCVCEEDELRVNKIVITMFCEICCLTHYKNMGEAYI